jgi:hypothetical protein
MSAPLSTTPNPANDRQRRLVEIAARYSLAEEDVRRLATNFQQLENEIDAACVTAGRSRGDVTLVAVTKYVPAPVIAALVDLGVRDVGESRPQNLAKRRQEVEELLRGRMTARDAGSNLRWHLIGHLQRNKAELAISTASVIHACDSERLLDRLAQLSGSRENPPPVLLEVNISGEASKHGFTSEEVRSWWLANRAQETSRADLSKIPLVGLMTMAPFDAPEETLHQVFGGLRDLRDELQELAPTQPLPLLSMGMSGDFPTAIECGATHIRVGTRLFEGLSPGCFLKPEANA